MRSTRSFLLCALSMLGMIRIGWPATDARQVVPAKIYSGYVVVIQGSIGSLNKRNFAIDTGAYPSIVDRELAHKLHLPTQNAELRVVDHNMNSELTSLPSLRVGPIQLAGLPVIVQDLSELSRTFGVRLDALIGLDVLARSSFRIDYRDKQVVFGRVDPLPLTAPIIWVNSMACVDVQVDNHPTRLLVDTGAASLLLFAKRLPWAAATSGRPRPYSNLGGNFQLNRVEARSLSVAGNDLGANPVFVSGTQNMSAYPFDGLLATGAMPFRQIAFDFERFELSWEPASSKADNARLQEAATPPQAMSFNADAQAGGASAPVPCAASALTRSDCVVPLPVRPVSSH